MYLKFFRIGIIIAALFMAATAFAENYYAYDEPGTAVALTVQDSIITARLGNPPGAWDAVFFSEIALNPAIPPEPIADNFVRLRVKTGYDPITLVQRLRQRDDILFANNSFFDPNGNPIYLTDCLVANFHTNVSQAQIDSMNTAHGVIVVDSFFNDPYWLMLKLTAASDHDVLTMGNLYHDSPLVRYAKAGMVLNLQLFSEPDDPYWQYQWQFHNTGQYGGTPGADIHLAEALNYPLSPSASVIVAILDNGFAAHEDLPASRFAGGYNYVKHTPNYQPAPKAHHGMATMGIIAATTNNGVGVSGISNNVRILAQKISDDDGFATDAEIAQAFSDAVLAGARVISCSWGCLNCGDLFFPTTTWWVRKIDSAGVSMVFAAGNSGVQHSDTIAWPADTPEAIAVGASDSLDERWDYSQYGPELDVLAPSSRAGLQGRFWTLDQMGNLGLNPWKNIQYQFTCDPPDVNYNCAFGGTSAACPEVAGIVALILLYRPDLVGKTEQIRQIIRYSADRTQYGSAPGDTARVNNQVGWGRVNAANALAMLCNCGDADGNGFVNLSDAVFLINFVFNGTPVPGDCGHQYGKGDFNGDGIVNLSDAVACINFVFVGAPCPHCPGISCWTQ